MIKKIIILWGLVLFNLTACQRASIQILEGIPAGKPHWVENTQDFWESNSFLYYRAVAESSENMGTARALAVSRGRLALAEQIRTQIKNQFVLTLQHTPYTISQTTQDIFEEKVSGVIITGTHIADSYTQTIRVRTRQDNTVVYRYYVLLQIHRQNYNQAINEVFNGTIYNLSSDKAVMEQIHHEIQHSLE